MDDDLFDLYHLPKGTLTAKKPVGCKVTGDITLTSKNPRFNVHIGELVCDDSKPRGKKKR